ncbi:hypothetical protein [Candidatus Nanohalovita haloferacivicina]|uniref:hypothetical protein n=1 Tax=Candidatus Nanohalovita haloferacivicina TaxID=2978046 RepID=UPI00325F95CD|nr:hypothetical protein HBNXNv_0414 [Candidatus Nanohalobia archaeon BNXNv]
MEDIDEMQDFELLDKGDNYFVAEADGETYLVEDVSDPSDEKYTLRVGDSDTIYVDEIGPERSPVDNTSVLVDIPASTVGESYEDVAENVMAQYFGASPFDMEDGETEGQESELDGSELESEEEPEKEKLTAENGFGLGQYAGEE